MRCPTSECCCRCHVLSFRHARLHAISKLSVRSVVETSTYTSTFVIPLTLSKTSGSMHRTSLPVLRHKAIITSATRSGAISITASAKTSTNRSYSLASTVQATPESIRQQQQPLSKKQSESTAQAQGSSQSAALNTSKAKLDALTQPQPATQLSSKAKLKTLADRDEELRLRMAALAGDGGEAGIEYENGVPVAMKRSVKNNMFRYI